MDGGRILSNELLVTVSTISLDICENSLSVSFEKEKSNFFSREKKQFNSFEKKIQPYRNPLEILITVIPVKYGKKRETDG